MEDFTSYTPGETLVVAVGAASVPSAPIGQTNKGRVTVRLFATVPTCIKVGTAPEATVNEFELAAFSPEYLDIVGGETIAAIRAASATVDGKLKITSMSKRSS